MHLDVSRKSRHSTILSSDIGSQTSSLTLSPRRTIPLCVFRRISPCATALHGVVVSATLPMCVDSPKTADKLMTSCGPRSCLRPERQSKRTYRWRAS